MTKIKKDNTMKKSLTLLFVTMLIASVLITAGCTANDTGNSGGTITVTDAFGRVVTIPDNPDKIAVSGSGSMRYFIYLDIDLDRVAAVDYQDSSLFSRSTEVRPYLLANPEIKNRPELGAAMAKVDNEKLMASGAEVLFMGGASSSNIETANEIQEKTDIPVVMFYVGNYVTKGDEIRETFTMLGDILHEQKRAKELIQYFNDVEADLKSRVSGVSADKPSVYVAGVSYNGAHGMDGTDPTYYPFTVLSADNVASSVESISQTGYAKVAKEQILEWDPEILFVDLGTLTAAEGGAIEELRNDASYQQLKAVKNGEIYTINPHTAMNVNHETTLANAYYIGKVLYPEQFADIDPAKKADEIYTFVDGAPVYDKLKANVNGLSYQKVVL